MGKRHKLCGITLTEIEHKTWTEDEVDGSWEWERIVFKVSKVNGKQIEPFNSVFAQSWCWEENGQWFVSVEAHKGNAWDWLHDDLYDVTGEH